jgi:hypothetical protein
MVGQVEPRKCLGGPEDRELSDLSLAERADDDRGKRIHASFAAREQQPALAGPADPSTKIAKSKGVATMST